MTLPSQDEVEAATRVWHMIKSEGMIPPPLEEIILRRRSENQSVLAMRVREAEALPLAIEAIKRHLPQMRNDRPESIRYKAQKLVCGIAAGTSPRDAVRALIWAESQADAQASGGNGLTWEE
jgi:hypothetical protein